MPSPIWRKPTRCRCFPMRMGLKQEGRENLLPYAGLVFNAFGPPNQLRQDAIERSAPHQAYVAEQCQRENLAPGGFGACIHARVDSRRYHRGRGAAAGALAALAPASIPPSTASARRSIAWRGFPTSWRGCATIRRWRATRSRKRSGSKARCRRSSGPRRGRSRSAGIAIGEGEKVLMFLGAANRDPRRWENPDSYDITRRTSGHVGYGSGIHMCVGQLVARLEGEVMLAALARKVAPSRSPAR